MRSGMMLFALLLMAPVGVGCAGKLPVKLGVENGLLAPCPDKPNCVISQGNDEQHFIPPFRYTGTREAAVADLRQIIRVMDRAYIIEERNDYLRVEFVTSHMRFRDDAEFYFAEPGLIHVRSGSRLGYSDFGKNRKRLERIRRLLIK